MLQNLPVVTLGGIFDSRTVLPGKKTSVMRTVREYELELFLEDGGISYINGDAFPVRRGTLLLARPNDHRRSRLHFRCRYIHFCFQDDELSARLGQLPHILPLKDPDSYDELLTQIIRAAYSEDPQSDLLAAAILLRCLQRLLDEGKVYAGSSVACFPAVQVAQQYIDSHFSDPLTLETIAAAVSLSPSYFHRIFTAATGRTPHSYLDSRRVRAAMTLLRTSVSPLAEIAEYCGFSSQAYFCYRFKEAVGITPGQYRRKTHYPFEL